MIRETLTCLLLFAVAVVAEDAPTPQKAPEFKPTHEQALKLENLQLKAKLALDTVQTSTVWNDYQAALRALGQECGEVIKANKWPNDVSCHFDTLQFTQDKPAAPAAPVKEKK